MKKTFLFPRKNLLFSSIFACAVVLLAFLYDPVQAENGNGAAGNWTVFRADAARTGYSNLAGPPEEMEMKWRWKMGNYASPVSSSPVIDSRGRICIGTEGGHVAVINNSGGQGFVFPVDGAITTSAAVNTDGSIFAITEDGYMYYLNQNGELQWKCDYSRKVNSSPLIVGNNAVFATNDNMIIGVNLNPDMRYAGKSKKLYASEVIEWSVSLQGSVKASPAFEDKTFFISAGRWMYAIESDGGEDNSTGNVKWKFGATSDIHSTPSVKDGIVYFGDTSGYLYAMDTKVEEDKDPLKWKRPLTGAIYSSVAIYDKGDDKKMIYVGTDAGRLYAYTQDGGYEWVFTATGAIRSSPAVDGNGDIYFGSDDGYVYALFPDGSLKWRYRTYGMVRSSPAIGSDNRLYIGSDDGYLYCFGKSTRDESKPDISIITASLYEIEYDGNPVTIAPKIDSETEGVNILGQIASVTIDLTALDLFGITQKERENPSPVPGIITTDLMLDDGMYEDKVAGDGIFTYAFGITSSTDLIGFDRTTRAFNHYLPPEMLAVGPVTAMITVTDLFGNKVSKPIVFNLVDKFRGTPPSQFILDNRLNRQTLILSFSSGTPSILSVDPSRGSPGILPIIITGRNTNFTKRRTKVEVFNRAGFRIASALTLPPNDDVNVLSDTELSARLNILPSDQVTEGELFGTWDVIVTTTFPDGEEEVVVGERLFEISAAAQKSGNSRASSGKRSFFTDPDCEFTFDVTNAYGGRPRNAPWRITSGYPRQVQIPDAQSGLWNLSVEIDDGCEIPPSFKILIKGTNYGYLTGQIRDGISGKGVDGALITAFTGESGQGDGNTTLSSGGGYYMLPLSAALPNYTVKAEKDGKTDIKRQVSITADEETVMNFSLFLGAACPLLEVLSPNAAVGFRSFRDNVLENNYQGKEWIRLYYKHADEVRNIIRRYPDVRAGFTDCIIYSFGAMSQFILNGSISPSYSLVVDDFMDKLKINAGSDLYHDLSLEQENIINFLNNHNPE